MLVLSRKLQQEIVIGDHVKITVLKVKGNTVRLGIEAPRSVRVMRGELTPIEEMVEVTVVFDDKLVESEKLVARNLAACDVVPFRTSPVETRPDDFHAPANRVDSGPTAVSYKSRLPRALHHDRLKQIVDELPSKKDQDR